MLPNQFILTNMPHSVLSSFVKLQEEEERKAKEEKEKREYEEYLAMKSQFSIEEEGQDAVMEADVSVNFC